MRTSCPHILGKTLGVFDARICAYRDWLDQYIELPPVVAQAFPFEGRRGGDISGLHPSPVAIRTVMNGVARRVPDQLIDRVATCRETSEYT
jgi:hypothetical protein